MNRAVGCAIYNAMCPAIVKPRFVSTPVIYKQSEKFLIKQSVPEVKTDTKTISNKPAKTVCPNYDTDDE